MPCLSECLQEYMALVFWLDATNREALLATPGASRTADATHNMVPGICNQRCTGLHVRIEKWAQRFVVNHDPMRESLCQSVRPIQETLLRGSKLRTTGLDAVDVDD